MPSKQSGFAHLLVLLVLLIGGIALGLTLIQKSQPLTPMAAEGDPVEVPLVRLYNPQTNLWTWSGKQSDIDFLVSRGYQNAGAIINGYTAQNHPAGTVPLYSLSYLADPPQTFLTTSEPEVSLLLGSAHGGGVATDQNPADNRADSYGGPLTSYWRLDDSGVFVYPPTTPASGMTPVYRLMYYNPGHIYNGIRYYSSDPEEIAALYATGSYINEGVAFYGPMDPLNPGQILQAAPNPCTVDQTGVCTAKIKWISKSPDLTITIKENPGSLFAAAPAGEQDAPWITRAGVTFQAFSKGRLLDELYVKGN